MSAPPDAPRRSSELALVLSGGGARAAYQAGVLRGLGKRFPRLRIPILTGASAGAINLGYLASQTGDLGDKTERLARLWSSLETEQVLEVGSAQLFGRALAWGIRLASGGHVTWRGRQGMFDMRPLRDNLTRLLEVENGVLSGIRRNLEEGALSSIAVTTASYTTGQSITWVQGRQIRNWERAHRRGVACELSIDHLLASAALPLLFPPVRIGDDFYGDGGMRMTAPLSPAIHLGADRILAISTRYIPGHTPFPTTQRSKATLPYPPPAQVAGVLLGTLFLDQFDGDALQLERLNHLIGCLPPEERGELRPVEIQVIRPSEDLGLLARAYEARLPWAFRWLERGLGTRSDEKSHVLLSMIMFQSDYARRLIELGERDAEQQLERTAVLLGGSAQQSRARS